MLGLAHLLHSAAEPRVPRKAGRSPIGDPLLLVLYLLSAR